MDSTPVSTSAVDEKAYWIALNRVSGIGAVRMAALLERCGSAAAAWQASIQELKAAGLDRRSLENLLNARRTLDVAAEWERIRRAGIHVITLQDDDYPANLRQIDAPPPLLYVRGSLQPSDLWAIGIVGTRRASVYGREVAHTLSHDLAAQGITVVSGLAMGIDTVAHRAALEAGGRTLAVLGSSVDQIYPPENRGLAQRIMEQGALISEYPLGTRPEAGNFPPRNRIISGLSKGVVIVEAGARSGALITARFAAEQGREVFAVPGSILHPGSAGCNTLIQQGATPLLSVNDILTQLNLEQVATQRAAHAAIPADPLESKLLGHLGRDPQHVDDLVRQMAMPAPQVSSLLAMMELKGLVRHVGAMTYVRR
ncbi:MAG TPA: DNA-processing protein DprA [Caldilineaceae bacterium]|nr:DNA-processing protein DprA [Caldilineaceae bacterium]